MATVAAVNTTFTATTSNFEKGSKRVEKMAQGMGARIRGNLSAAIPGFNQLVGAAAIGYLAKKAVDAFKKQFEELGALSDQGMNLGVTTNQLQSLRFGAGQAGVGAQELDKAIAKMSDTIADAADGDVKEAVDAMTALGLSAQQLATMSPDEQFRKVADSLAKIESTTQRIQVARDVFGRSGVNLIAFLQGGSKGIEETAARFRELGGNLTELDVAVADLAGDALTEVGTAFDNLWKQFTVEISPAVAVLAEAFATFIGSAAQGTGETYELSRAIIGFFGGVADAFNAVRIVVLELESGLLSLRASIEDWLGDRKQASESFREAAKLAEVARDLRENPVSSQWADALEDVIKRAAEAAKRSKELRDGAGGRGESAAAAASRSIQPAAVELGTTAAIEAINKAGSPSKSDQKQVVKHLQDINAGVRDVERALGALGFEPANLA